MLAAAFLLAVFLLVRYYPDSKLCRMLSKGRTVLSAVFLPLAVILIALEGTFALNVHQHLFFLAIVLLLMASLLAAVCEEISRKASTSSVLSHLGLLLILFGGFFGAPDFQEGNMAVVPGEERYIAASSQKALPLVLPFKVQLKEFRTDYYPDGVSPKQYSSVLLVDAKECCTSVNHPCFHKGWFIYQSSFDESDPNTSVLKCVKDPWLPLIYLGMLLLASGAVLSLRGVWKSRYVLPAVLALTVLFAFVSVAKINFGTLVPALRSLWFVPHLIIYMLAYSLLAIAVVLGLISLLRKGEGKEALLSFKLLCTASSLLILGMLCGAVWAKSAWGDYWTWDPKECWAAVTWLLTLAAMHLPHPGEKNRKLMIFIVFLSFLAMQVTWYGVNYLPSSNNSMHTYNNNR